MCLIKGEKGVYLCRRLHECHENELHLYRVDGMDLHGYVNPKNGLLFIPYGDYMEVYGEDEYTHTPVTVYNPMQNNRP